MGRWEKRCQGEELGRGLRGLERRKATIFPVEQTKAKQQQKRMYRANSGAGLLPAPPRALCVFAAVFLKSVRTSKKADKFFSILQLYQVILAGVILFKLRL